MPTPLSSTAGRLGSFSVAARGRACIYQVLSARAWKNYRAIRRAVSLDVTDPEQTLAVIQAKQPTHVMHLAGISVVSQANQDVRKTWDVNTQRTLNVALGIKQGVPTYRLLFCSSAQVYGGSFGTGEPLGEDGCARHGQRLEKPRVWSGSSWERLSPSILHVL